MLFPNFSLTETLSLPRGERGLKSQLSLKYDEQTKSLPAWGAWIEMKHICNGGILAKSLPAWGAWIEIPREERARHQMQRRSPRGERGLK